MGQCTDHSCCHSLGDTDVNRMTHVRLKRPTKHVRVDLLVRASPSHHEAPPEKITNDERRAPVPPTPQAGFQCRRREIRRVLCSDKKDGGLGAFEWGVSSGLLDLLLSVSCFLFLQISLGESLEVFHQAHRSIPARRKSRSLPMLTGS
jgi:hypothetical protein